MEGEAEPEGLMLWGVISLSQEVLIPSVSWGMAAAWCLGVLG